MLSDTRARKVMRVRACMIRTDLSGDTKDAGWISLAN